MLHKTIWRSLPHILWNGPPLSRFQHFFVAWVEKQRGMRRGQPKESFCRISAKVCFDFAFNNIARRGTRLFLQKDNLSAERSSVLSVFLQKYILIGSLFLHFCRNTTNLFRLTTRDEPLHRFSIQISEFARHIFDKIQSWSRRYLARFNVHLLRLSHAAALAHWASICIRRLGVDQFRNYWIRERQLLWVAIRIFTCKDLIHPTNACWKRARAWGTR